MYRFDVDLSQNFVKKMHVGADEYHKYPGASHCDELPYLFKTGPGTNISSPTIDSKEFAMIIKMVETFTSFAASGDPNNLQLGAKWEAVEENVLPFKCLNINQDETKMMTLPEGESLKTLNEVFQKENVDLF